MASQPLDPHDAHTYRILMRHPGDSMPAFKEKEVAAAYYKSEDGFVVFKDFAHAMVFSVAEPSVLEIERLRSHALLAVSDDELRQVVGALRGNADRAAGADFMPLADDLTRLADALERLNGDRLVKEPSPHSRAAGGVMCTCGTMTGGRRDDNPACKMHHGTPALNEPLRAPGTLSRQFTPGGDAS